MFLTGTKLGGKRPLHPAIDSVARSCQIAWSPVHTALPPLIPKWVWSIDHLTAFLLVRCDSVLESLGSLGSFRRSWGPPEERKEMTG